MENEVSHSCGRKHEGGISIRSLITIFMSVVLVITMTPMPSYADDSARGLDAASLDAASESVDVAIPIPSGKELTYNGEWQLGVEPAEGWSFACEDGIEGYFDPLAGCRKIDVGEYSCTLRLDEGYVWEDGSYDDVVVAWSVQPKIAVVPASAELTYTGEALQGVVVGEGYELSGDVEAIEEGDYIAIATLLPNYVWEDGSADPKQVSWSIAVGEEKPEGDAESDGSDESIIVEESSVEETDDDATATAQSSFSVNLPEGGRFEADSYELKEWRDLHCYSDAYVMSSSTFDPYDYYSDYCTGLHEVTFTLNEEYIWSDGTTDPKTVTLEIMLGVVSLPEGGRFELYSDEYYAWEDRYEYQDGFSMSSDTLDTGSSWIELEPGVHSVTFTLWSGYEWSDGTTDPKTVSIEVLGNVDLADHVDGFELSYATCTYSGKAKKPSVEHWRLTEGEDFEVSYSNNVNAGKATVTLTGIGSYYGSSVTLNFTIDRKALKASNATLARTEYVANGTLRKPAVTVKDGTKTLVKGTDYTVSYSNNKVAGLAKATITGKGNYKGTVTKYFNITPAKSGWFSSNGYWYYKYSSGLTSGWKTINGVKYYFNPTTKRMSTGLKTLAGKKYYFDSSGAMVKNAWRKHQGSWYYLGTTGAAKSGWLSSGGVRYYLDPDDKQMVTGLRVIGGKAYSFNSAGVMEANCWRNYDGHWYCFASSGAARSGWVAYGSDWYWFDSIGKGADDEGRLVDGEYAFFNSDGVWVKSVPRGTTGWVHVKKAYYYSSDGDYCYEMGCDDMYYIDSRGRLVGTYGDRRGQHKRIGSYEYWFSSNGQVSGRRNVNSGAVYYWQHESSCFDHYGCNGSSWVFSHYDDNSWID